MSRAVVALLVLFASTSALAEDKWIEASRDDDLVIYNRARSGSEIKELKATAILDAPAWACHNVVSDEGNFKSFMPYTAESKIVLDKGGYRYVYQRIDAPFVSDRDYTVRIKDVSQRMADGKTIWKKVWSAANEKGPKASDDAVRLVVVDGFWQFEELGADKTRVTYYVYTDPGGVLPAFVINGANKQAIPTLFDVVEEQARSARYQKTKPTLPAEAAPPPATLTAPSATTTPAATAPAATTPSAPASTTPSP